MTAAGAANGLQTAIRKEDDGRLDSADSRICLHKRGAFPCLAHVIGVFEIEFPTIAFVRSWRNETALTHHGFVLDRTVDIIGKGFTTAPGLTAILRTANPSFPSCHVGTYLEIELKFTAGGLKEHGIPTSLAVVVADSSLTTVGSPGSPFWQRNKLSTESGLLTRGYQTDFSLRIGFDGLQFHAISHHLRSRPFLGAFRLTAHPYANIRITLPCSTEISGYEVTFPGFYNRGGMTLREISLCVKELIGYDACGSGIDSLGSILGNSGNALEKRSLEVIAATAELFRRSIGEINGSFGVGRYFHMPQQLILLLLPLAHNRTIDALIRSTDVVHFGHGEVGFQGDMTETVGTLNTCSILKEPTDKVAKQHHVVAAVHFWRSRITIPEFPGGGGTLLCHVAP